MNICHKQNKTNQGFTLIEMVVVVGLVAVLGITMVNLMFSTLKGSTKENAMQKVKLNGDNALVALESLVRSASNLEDNGAGAVCNPGMNALGVKKVDGTSDIIRVESGRLVSNAGFITGEDVWVSSLVFNCQRSISGTPTYVRVELTISVGNTEGKGEGEFASETFKTGVSLRAY